MFQVPTHSTETHDSAIFVSFVCHRLWCGFNGNNRLHGFLFHADEAA
jgi:hypothetical protein